MVPKIFDKFEALKNVYYVLNGKNCYWKYSVALILVSSKNSKNCWFIKKNRRDWQFNDAIKKIHFEKMFIRRNYDMECFTIYS